MEIKFTNIDNLWVAEFEVTSDFNLHLERDTEGRLDIYQRTAGGEYEYIYDIGYLNKRTVYDNDFQALVYPKWIKIKSAVKPLIATITTDGEVNEVVYQAKEIEITSNGTTKVTADTGYTALASVNVKVNVPQSGGGAESGENTYEYIDLRGLEGDLKAYFATYAFAVRFKEEDNYTMPIAPLLVGEENPEVVFGNIMAAMFDLSFVIDYGIDGKIEAREIFTAMGIDPSSLPRLTKEEFYNLKA